MAVFPPTLPRYVMHEGSCTSAMGILWVICCHSCHSCHHLSCNPGDTNMKTANLVRAPYGKLDDRRLLTAVNQVLLGKGLNEPTPQAAP